MPQVTARNTFAFAKSHRDHPPPKREPACTACSSRKVACRVESPNASCSNCLSRGLPCSKAPFETPLDIDAAADRAGRLGKGKVLAKIRKAAITAKPAQSAVATLHLGPTSTSSRLSTFELGASLGHALVSASLETWRVMLAAPVSGGAAAPQTTIRAQDMRPAGFELEDEILYACYTAIGARRSTHSAIIGDSTVVAIEPLGARRETACLALADRAVAMLASAYQTLIARSPQPKLGVMAMIKTMLLFVDPASPAYRQLLSLLDTPWSTSTSDPKPSIEEAIRSPADLLDVRIAIRLASTPSVPSSPYFTDEHYSEALHCLRNVELVASRPTVLSAWVLCVQLAVLHRLPTLEMEARDEPNGILLSFSQRWADVDLAINYVHCRLAQLAAYPSPAATSYASPSHPSHPASSPSAESTTSSTSSTASTRPPSKDDYLGQVPDIFATETALLRSAERLALDALPSGGSDEQAYGWRLARMEVRRIARLRWLSSFKWTSVALDELCKTLTDAHWVARRLESSFSLLPPDWMDLVIRAAAEAERGEGELASAQIDWADIERIHGAFDRASIVFASAAQTAAELRRRLINVRQPSDVLAADMVTKAVAELVVPL